jgi:glycosyltransferase involved in cell wall biosynthesis
MNKFLQVSVVVPVYNGAQTIGLCLDSLMNLDYPRSQLEIIVVDNNSTDGTAEMIKRYPVKYLFEPKRNRSRARNKGIKEAQGHLIAFTDADCVVDKGWLRHLVQGFTHPMIGGCGGEIRAYLGRRWIQRYCYWQPDYDEQKMLLMDPNRFLPVISTRNTIFRRDVMTEVGLFNEVLPRWGDSELCWRIFLRGFQLKYIPEAVIYYYPWDNLSRFWEKWFRSSQSGVYLSARYRDLSYFDLPRTFGAELRNQVITGKRLFQMRLTKDKHQVGEKILLLFLDCFRTLASVLGSFWGRLRWFNTQEITALEVDDRLLWRPILGGETILFRTKKPFIYYLNPPASEIWELWVMESEDTEEITQLLAQKYDVELNELKRDMVEVLKALKQNGLMDHH